MYFKEKSIDFENLSNNYKLVLNDSVWEIKDGSDKKIKPTELDSLKVQIEEVKDTSLTKPILRDIKKIITFQKLSDGGCKFSDESKYLIYNNKLIKIIDGDESYCNEIDRELYNFLSNNIPKNIFDNLKNNLKIKSKSEKKEKLNNRIIEKNNISKDESKNQNIEKEIPCVELINNVSLAEWKNEWETIFNVIDKAKSRKNNEIIERVNIKNKKNWIKEIEECDCPKCKEYQNVYQYQESKKLQYYNITSRTSPLLLVFGKVLNF